MRQSLKDTSLFYEFIFLNIKFDKYHHTDQRRGSPMNYLAYMKKGEARIVSEKTTIYVHEGDVFYIPKNLPYQSYWYGDDVIDFLSFGFLNLHTSESLGAGLQIVPCGSELCEKILNIPTTGHNITCRTLSTFYDVMDEISPLLEDSCENNEGIIADRIKKCIADYPYLSVAEIAKKCAISESYVYPIFKKITRVTPNDYKQRTLCEKGIELLLTTDKKVEEISDMLKFSSSSYFRKVLKRHTGSTPREIRKNKGF